MVYERFTMFINWLATAECSAYQPSISAGD